VNEKSFESGKAAYQQGDLTLAIEWLSRAKMPGEVSGQVDHLLGNCLMKTGRYAEAATAYGDALHDKSYGHEGALACNRGRALLAAGKPQEAIASLRLATKDESYASQYKANIALGNAYLKVGNVRDAGVAFRNAAIDEANPDPSGALRNLGGCFMQMGRAVDAIEAYRTALDFTSSAESQNVIYADLGLAYVAANRMSEAIDAFGRATQDGTYSLTPEANAAYDAARKAVSAITGTEPSETDALLAAAGYGTGEFDPLDPLGESGEFMPSPEDTGFFSVSEEDLVAEDHARGKGRHTGLKVFIVLLLLVAALGGGGYYAYSIGLGWPTQEAVISGIFKANAAGQDTSQYIASSVTDDTRSTITNSLPASTTDVTITDLQKSATSASAKVTVTLSAGGEQNYEVSLVREGIGWKVSKVSALFASQSGTSSIDQSTAATGDQQSSANSSGGEANASQDNSGQDASAGSGETTDEGGNAEG